jgi:predicted RNA-binding Zn-ribbon protein involved in translation (DUF1610 family)
MYTREEFDQRRAEADRVESREGLTVAMVSVALGLGQLGFIRWADAHLARGPRLAAEGSIFVAYAILVAALLWRLQRRTRAAHPVCPKCGVVLSGMSERVASATGRCDRCGAQVIA